MARGRMINIALTRKDKFLQLSCTTQLLYFHLCLNADDDGFVDNAFTLIDQLPVTIEDFKTLIDKKYVIVLEEYLYVITHWRMHNSLDKNHYTGTAYVEYLKKLFFDENKVYTLSKGTNLYEYHKNRGYLDKILSSNPIPIEDNLKKN